MKMNASSVKLWHQVILVLQVAVCVHFKVAATSLHASTGEPTAVVKGTNVNVRQAPSIEAKVITQLQDGAVVTIVSKQNHKTTINNQSDYWYQVSGKFGTGWIFGAFLTVQSPAKATNLNIDPTVLCAELSNSYDCHKAIEQEWVHYYPGYVERAESQLRLKLDDGNWESFTDLTDVDDDGYIGYNLTAVFESPRAYYVDVQHYEGGAGLLIARRTGAEYDVLGKPIFSPSTAKFACFNMDLQAAYDPTGIEIWSWGDGKCIREFDLRDGTDGEDRRWGPTGIQWVSESRILVSRMAVNEESGELYSVPPLAYEFAKGKWQAVRK